MKKFRFFASILGVCALLPVLPVAASDHADPQEVLNPFKIQDDPVANITDLHAFLADDQGRPIVEDPTIPDPGSRSREATERLAKANQLIVSLCVRRRLLPNEIADLEQKQRLSSYRFSVHLDLNPTLRNPDFVSLDQEIALLDQAIKAQSDVRKEIRDKEHAPAGMPAAGEETAQAALNELLKQRGERIARRQSEDLLERLYGGIVDQPGSIADEAALNFQLSLKPDGDNSEVVIVKPDIHLPGEVNIVSAERKTALNQQVLVEKNAFKAGGINVQAGIFDDPFIFPRFFRGNVIGIVVSIPLDRLHQPNGAAVRGQPILLWATTHEPNGAVSDFVGRSLRTQLPRFGYLNALPPSQHVAEIQRVHAAPTLKENTLATFIAPLEAHRHYDSVPDVMVFDLAKPAKFPNGRWLGDDVAKTLADCGETLLLELSCSESRQTPRATTNDKPFYSSFPYLAPRWTRAQIDEHIQPGIKFGDFDLGSYQAVSGDEKIPGTFAALRGARVPDAQDRGATAPLDLHPDVWQSIWTGLVILLLLAVFAGFVLSRRPLAKILVFSLGLFSLCYVLAGGLSAWRWLLVVLFLFIGWITLLLLLQLLPKKLHRYLAAALLVLVVGVAVWVILPPRAKAIAGPMPASAENPKPMPAPATRPNEMFFRAIYSGLLIGGFGLYALYAFGLRRGVKVAAEERRRPLGPQSFGRDDNPLVPYSYTAAWARVSTKPYYDQNDWKPGLLKVRKTRLTDVAAGLLSLTKDFLLLDAAKRTVKSRADFRLGDKGKGVKRIIHPNGVCLRGEWNIENPSKYTGFFAKGSRGFVIARYSTGLSVYRGKKRTLSMVGKLYPSENFGAGKDEFPASFITQEDLGAAYTPSIFAAHLLNAPNITLSRRFPDIFTPLILALAFARADMKNTIRQLYEIAELEKDPETPTCCPKFMRLTVAGDSIHGDADTEDFRDELLAHFYKPTLDGETGKRKLVFRIWVADQGEVKGLLNKKLCVKEGDWQNIGTITFTEAVASEAGDQEIHFHHPKWRKDPNDPNSETGPSPLAAAISKVIEQIHPVLRFIFRQ